MSNHHLLLLSVIHHHHWPHHWPLLRLLLLLLLHMTDWDLRQIRCLASHWSSHHHLPIWTAYHSRLTLVHDCHSLLLLHLHTLIGKLRPILNLISWSTRLALWPQRCFRNRHSRQIQLRRASDLRYTLSNSDLSHLSGRL